MPSQKGPIVLKKVLITLVIVILALLAALAVTKPERTAHYDAVRAVVMKSLEAKVNKAVPNKHLRTQATYIALGAADDYLKKNLLVYEHTFYNNGVLVYKDFFIPVSIGIMGHVFLTFSANDVNQLTEQVDVQKMIESNVSRGQTP